MIIRHAEKPEGSVQGVDIGGNDGTENLTVQGWQRAGALARFFAPLSGQFQRPGIAQPQFLFASGPVQQVAEKRRRRWIEKSTAGADHHAAEPTHRCHHRLRLRERSRNTGGCCGRRLWGRGSDRLAARRYPAIAAAIPGASGFPSPWPGSRFDIVWVFDLRPDGTYLFSQVPQMLLAG